MENEGSSSSVDGGTGVLGERNVQRIILQEQGNPNLKISPFILDGSNFLPWSRSITRFLSGKMKLEFIDGTSKAPSLDDPSYKGWKSNNDIVASWLIIHMAGGFYYAVPAGTRDGLVSKESDVVDNIAMPFFDVKQLEENFARKGLSLVDMVTLSGAQTIGDSHCSLFSDRLYDFHSTGAADQSMDPKYVSYLKTKCPAPDSPQDPTVPLDVATPKRLVNKYYGNLKYHRGLLSSDQALMDRADTARMVYANINRGSMWAHKFSESMVRMGSIGVLTGSQGQIRKSCRLVN